jgi:ABC-type multidrug transport system ATPase subunit
MKTKSNQSFTSSVDSHLPMVFCHNISKAYGKVQALKRSSFSVQKGELFGIIGPDGAGKTTLFRMLTTLIPADEGSIAVNGWDSVTHYQDIRNHVGYMPGRFSLYQDLSVEENMRFFAGLFSTSITANYHLIKDIYQQLEPFKTRRAGALSGGMKQKLALCCTLIHNPQILFLDEPTTGVDLVSRKEFWTMLGQLKGEGITILVSTPYMDEAGLCDRIALVQNGEFLKIDTPENIIAHFQQPLMAVQSTNMSQLLFDLRKHPAVESCFAFGDVHHVTFREQSVSRAELERYLQQLKHTDIHIQPIAASIEDCFMALSTEREKQLIVKENRNGDN